MLKKIRIRHFLKVSLIVAIGCFNLIANAKDFSSSVRQRPSKLTAENVGVIYNVNDRNSIEVAKYYQQARNIPKKNLIKVQLLTDGNANVSTKNFNKLKESINEQLSPEIKVLLLMWSTPYRVGCGSITSALTLGSIDSK